ncbi:MAG: response regulator [Myxococcales bacterium]|nr:response regulator [Myxococcales bacterium]
MVSSEPPAVAIRFDSDSALASWYAQYVAQGFVTITCWAQVATGSGIRLDLTAGELQLVARARALEPRQADGTVRVALEAEAELAAAVASQQLDRRLGRTAENERRRRASPLRVRFRSYHQLWREYVERLTHGALLVPTELALEVGSSSVLTVTFPDNQSMNVRTKVIGAVDLQPARETRPGKCFEVQLTDGAQALLKEADRLLAHYLAKRPYVLVVDDDVLFREALSDGLAEAGVDVETAEDGYDASHLLMRDLYELDAITMDLQMPGLDGHTLAQRVRRVIGSDVQIVVISGGAEAELKTRVGPVADQVISKSIPLPEIVYRVRRMLLQRHEFEPKK